MQRKLLDNLVSETLVLSTEAHSNKWVEDLNEGRTSLSRQAHQAAAGGNQAASEKVQKQIDVAAEGLWE